MAGIVALREWLRSKPGHGLREEREKPMPGLTPNWALFLASLCLVGVIVSVFNLCSHTTAPAAMFINPGPVQDVGTVRQNATVRLFREFRGTLQPIGADRVESRHGNAPRPLRPAAWHR